MSEESTMPFLSTPKISLETQHLTPQATSALCGGQTMRCIAQATRPCFGGCGRAGIPFLVALQSTKAFLSNISSLSLQHLSSAVFMAAAVTTEWEIAAFSV